MKVQAGQSENATTQAHSFTQGVERANLLAGTFPPSIQTLKRLEREDHSRAEDKGHAHWLMCGCEQARGIRKAEGYGEPGLRWDSSFGGGWVTAPAEKL